MNSINICKALDKFNKANMSNLNKIKPYEASQTNKKRHSKVVTQESVDVQ